MNRDAPFNRTSVELKRLAEIEALRIKADF